MVMFQGAEHFAGAGAFAAAGFEKEHDRQAAAVDFHWSLGNGGDLLGGGDVRCV